MIGSFWFNSFSAGGGGAAADYELISTTILGSAAASVTFSGLGTSAAAYKHLQIRAVYKMDTASETALMQFNGDTATNYRVHRLTGNGSTVTSADFGPKGSLVPLNATGTATGVFSTSIVDIFDFASTTKNKTVRSLSGRLDTATEINLYSGAWFSTAAITSITLPATAGNIVTGSRFSLYGLK